MWVFFGGRGMGMLGLILKDEGFVKVEMTLGLGQ